MNIIEKIKSGFILLDGAMGTELQKQGLKAGELPERWNIQNPAAVTNIHKAYLKAGSDIILANTFGANTLKFDMDELDSIICAALSCAKNAVAEYSEIKHRYVALDIGPLGKLLKPLGDLEFEKAVEIFSATVKLGVKYGADLIFVETMNDSLETKAAVLAAKENSDLPLFVTNVYDATGKLMTGANPAAMVAMLEGLKVDALGLNCSLGPNEMKGIVNELVRLSSTPVIVKPNAGLPTTENGKAVFNVDANCFGDAMLDIANMGAAILGGCCGTSPEYIKAVSDNLKNASFNKIKDKNITVISSYTHAVEFHNKPVLIGERINPTGKKRFKQALMENDMPYILNEGIKQANAGAHALDVNVGLPDIDEADFICRTVKELQAVTDLPLQIDTALPTALEKGLRAYNGKAMINSVNGKKESMDAVFPLAAKYGGVIVALTLDENGIPATANERVAIAEKIIATAKQYGISQKDIIVDPLAMAVSADPNAGNETLKAVKLLTEKGIKTSLGVSNISFGLPNRDFVTSTFFALALENGLSAAIMNPFSLDMQKVYYSYLALKGIDSACKKYIDFAADLAPENTVFATQQKQSASVNGLFDAIVNGLKADATKAAAELLKNTEPLTVINQYIVPALDEVGKGFEAKTVYLPQLLMSAEAATCAFDEVKTKMPSAASNGARKIVIATVKGDIHDIGKNIVKVLLQNYGFSVIDLGKDVEPEKVLEAVKSSGAAMVGLSALMTTTLPAMEQTVLLLKENYPNVKIIVGGAVLTQEYANQIKADKYAKTAMDAVRYAEQIFKK